MEQPQTFNKADRGMVEHAPAEDKPAAGAEEPSAGAGDTAIPTEPSRTARPTSSHASRGCCRCCCCCCRRRKFLDNNPEAIAWALDTVASGLIFVGSGAFLMTALMKLAKQEAGCETEPPEGEHKTPDCNKKVHGMKPSSILTTFATVIGMAAAVMMPICGAIVDTTSYRRGLGRVLAALFSMGTFVTIFLSEENWFAISICFALLVFIGLFKTMALYAYLPELTNDEATINRFTKTFAVLSYAAMVLYLAIIVGIATGVAFKSDRDTIDDEIGTARMSQSVAFVVSAVCFTIAWGRFLEPRPPARILDPSESLWSTGFLQLYRTALNVHRNYPMVQWFFASIAVGDAASSALLVLAITYLTEVLEFSGAENGAVVLIMLISCIPGGYLSSSFTRNFNPVSSSIAAVIVLIMNTTLVAVILKGPEQEMGAYLLAVGWGVGTGWKWTVDRMLYAMILPKNQNAEFSGSYVFFKQCLTWLPPLVFTAMNENDISLRIGMGSVNIFFVLALLFLYFGVGIKRYDEYVRSISNNDDVESMDEHGEIPSEGATVEISLEDKNKGTDDDVSDAAGFELLAISSQKENEKSDLEELEMRVVKL